MQQQATQGLFRSPEGKKKFKFNAAPLTQFLCKKKRKKKKDRENVDLPILAHFQKIPSSLSEKKKT